MKACFYKTYGGPEVLEFGTLPDPQPTPDQVLIRLEAGGVAPLDWKLRSGLLAEYFTPQFPKIPGRDGTGKVIAVGANVRDFSPGDRVCVMAPPVSSPGTSAELLAAPAELAVALPNELSMAEGAALINAGLSAWISAVRTANVGTGDKVLVHAGAGAVGGLLVQLCRHLGAEVIATCRSTNKDYVLSLGAKKTIAYDTEDFTDVKGQDIVFDLMGGDVHDRSYQVLKPGGHLVYLTAAPIVDRGAETGIRVTRAMVSDDRQAVAEVLSLAARGIVRPQVAEQHPLENLAEAHRRLENGSVTRGRLILTI